MRGGRKLTRASCSEGSEDEGNEDSDVGPIAPTSTVGNDAAQESVEADDTINAVPVATDTAKITIIEED